MDKSAVDLPICENVPLAPLTTLGVGGPARFFVRARTENQVLEALDYARIKDCPVFILGGGTNIVVSDAGFPGLVLRIEIAGIQPRGDGTASTISAGAGVEWDAVVHHCIKLNLAGIECLSGIPGTVGGAPVQNIGAYGEEISEVVLDVRALNRATHNIETLSCSDCGFAYRSSIFNTTCREHYVILRVDLILRADGKPRISYSDLRKNFESQNRFPTLSEVRDEVLQIRKSKSMVLSEDDCDSKGVGSFFKNPALTPSTISEVQKEARTRGLLGLSESIPRFAAFGGKEKLPAAWLIERAGFHKGYAHGRAGISSKHALALINRGGATAQDILDLMRLIQANVQAVFGVNLQPEPIFVGFEKEIR